MSAPVRGYDATFSIFRAMVLASGSVSACALEQTPSERQRIQPALKRLIYEALEN
jgi:hypothetical protein